MQLQPSETRGNGAAVAVAADRPIFASPRQFRLATASLVLSTLLFGTEIAHYLISTDLGAADKMEAGANLDPRCKPLRSGYDLLCPFPGYNSIQMTCTLRGCGDRNLNLPPTTGSSHLGREEMERADDLSSLLVEAPYSHGDPVWQDRAAALRGGGEWFATPSEIAGAPKTMEEAQRVARQRSLRLSEEIAEERLQQHAP